MNLNMVSEYSMVRIRATGRIGTVVEFDNRKNEPIHLVELTDTDDDDRMVWVAADGLDELPEGSCPPPGCPPWG